MQIITFYCCLLLCFSNCKTNESLESRKIKNSDIIEVIYHEEDGSSFVHTTSSDRLLEDFIKIFNGEIKYVDCKTIGKIKFYSKDSLLFDGIFSIASSDCQYFIKDEKAWKLTYNVGMYLSEEYHYFKKNK